MGDVIHVEFGRPPTPEPDLKSIFATSILSALQEQGADRLDIAEAVADVFVEQWHSVLKWTNFTISHTCKDETPQFQKALIEAIVAKVNLQLEAYCKEVTQKIVECVSLTAHKSAVLTAGLLLRA
jgi:hypothetical protein